MIVASIVALLALSSTAQETPAARIKRIAADARVATAMTMIEHDHDRLVSEIITLTEIPSPPFKEDARGAAFLRMLQQTSLTDIERDKEGNVMGLRRGTGAAGWRPRGRASLSGTASPTWGCAAFSPRPWR